MRYSRNQVRSDVAFPLGPFGRVIWKALRLQSELARGLECILQVYNHVSALHGVTVLGLSLHHALYSSLTAAADPRQEGSP